MAKRDLVHYHLVEVLRGAQAAADGDDDLARRLRAMTKLRLITMSEEELWRLAELTSCPPSREAS